MLRSGRLGAFLSDDRTWRALAHIRERKTLDPNAQAGRCSIYPGHSGRILSPPSHLSRDQLPELTRRLRALSNPLSSTTLPLRPPSLTLSLSSPFHLEPTPTPITFLTLLHPILSILHLHHPVAYPPSSRSASPTLPSPLVNVTFLVASLAVCSIVKQTFVSSLSPYSNLLNLQ